MTMTAVDPCTRATDPVITDDDVESSIVTLEDKVEKLGLLAISFRFEPDKLVEVIDAVEDVIRHGELAIVQLTELLVARPCAVVS